MVTRHPEGSVHVRLNEPISKRRDVLRIAIDVVELMRRYEKIKHLNTRKHDELERFRGALKSLNRLLWEVRLKEMPIDEEGLKEVRDISGHGKVFASTVFMGKAKNAPKKVEKKALVPTAEQHMSALDRELDDLRRKLNSL